MSRRPEKTRELFNEKGGMALGGSDSERRYVSDSTGAPSLALKMLEGIEVAMELSEAKGRDRRASGKLFAPGRDLISYRGGGYGDDQD